MKNFRSTGVMALLVAAIAGYTAWEYRKAQQDAGLAEGERLAFTITPKTITGFKIIRGGEVIEVQKSGDSWQVIKPVGDDGDGPSIDGFVYPLLSQRVRPFAEEEDTPKTGEKWAEFGLEPATAVIEVMSKDSSEMISVSSKNAFDGSFYVRQDDKLVLGDAGLAQLKERPSTSFRSRYWWREKAANLISIRVQNLETKESYKLVRKDKVWEVDPAPPYPIDSEKIREWVDRVKDFTPAEIAREQLDDFARTEFLLAKPSFTISVEYKKPDDQAAMWVATIGQDKATDVWVYTTLRPTIYKTTVSALENIRLPLSFFRSSSKAFDFPLEQARKVEIRTATFNHTFKKSGEKWVIDGDAPGVELDQERLIQFIQNVRTMEAGEFPNVPGSGFKDPQVRILNHEDKTIFALSWGDEYKAKEPHNKGAAFRYVKTDQSSDVMGVASDKLARLLDAKMVKEKK